MGLVNSELRDAGLNVPHKEIPSPFKFELPIRLTKEVSVLHDVSIGAHTYMNGGFIRERVTIGRYCSIAYYVTLGMSGHMTHLLSTHPIAWKAKVDERHKSPFISGSAKSARTTIGHDVWIAQGGIVLSGLNIGTGAIVGAGAVVTKDVPPYAIVGGVPAKIIRFRFDPGTIQKLLASEWWMLPMEIIKTLPTNNIGESLRLVSEYVGPRAEFKYIEI